MFTLPAHSQNVDGLEKWAGIKDTCLKAVHGNLGKYKCSEPRCKVTMTEEQWLEVLVDKPEVRCPQHDEYGCQG